MKTIPDRKQDSVKYSKVRKLFGIYYIFGHDKAGWWITDNKGFKTTLHVAWTKVLRSDNITANQIILGRYMLMWMTSPNRE